MAMTLNTYRAWFNSLVFSGGVDVDDISLRCHLMTSSYSPSVTDVAWATISSNEVSATGYSAVDLTAANISISESGGTLTFDYTTDIVFTASGSNVTGHYYVIRETDGIGYLGFYGFLDDTSGGTDVTYNDGETLTITPSASGLYSMVHDT